MLRLFMNDMEYAPKVYINAFCSDPDAKCAFIARDEKRLLSQSTKFAQAAQRKTGAHLLTIDVAQKAAEGKTLLNAVLEEMYSLARSEGIDIPDSHNRTSVAFELSRRLCGPVIEGTVPTPIIFFRHFQCCALTTNSKNLSDYVFLRELPCRLVILANMEIVEIEKSFMMIGGQSIVAPLVKQITIENDIPYRCNEISRVCAAIEEPPTL